MVCIVEESGVLRDCKAVDLEGRHRVAEGHGTSWSGLYEIGKVFGAEGRWDRKAFERQSQGVSSHSKSSRYR